MLMNGMRNLRGGRGAQSRVRCHAIQCILFRCRLGVSRHDGAALLAFSHMVSWIPTEMCLPDAAYLGPHHSN